MVEEEGESVARDEMWRRIPMADVSRSPRRPPRGLQRLVWRMPILLYRLGLGWLLGRRFLLLTHIGRKTGRPRQAVLEIVEHDPAAEIYYVASGFGPRSDWYRNILKTPQVTIQVGNRRMRAVARPLSPEESGEIMARYARRHPTAARRLARVLGLDVDGTEEGYRRIGEAHIPFVALQVER